MNDSQILGRALVLATKRAKIIDQALSDAGLLSPNVTVALQEIRAELDELRAIQIANRGIQGISFQEVMQKEREIRQKYGKGEK